MTDGTRAHPDAAARLRIAVARLARQLRRQTPGRLTLSQSSALATIEQHGPLRVGNLGCREGVSAATATRLVAVLVDQALVQRDHDTVDGRSWQVSITPAGRAELDAARRLRTTRLAKRLAELDPGDVERLREALGVLERLADED